MTAGLLRLRPYASLAEIDAEPAAQKAKVVSLAWRETRDDQWRDRGKWIVVD